MKRILPVLTAAAMLSSGALAAEPTYPHSAEITLSQTEKTYLEVTAQMRLRGLPSAPWRVVDSRDRVLDAQWSQSPAKEEKPEEHTLATGDGKAGWRLMLELESEPRKPEFRTDWRELKMALDATPAESPYADCRRVLVDVPHWARQAQKILLRFGGGSRAGVRVLAGGPGADRAVDAVLEASEDSQTLRISPDFVGAARQLEVRLRGGSGQLPALEGADAVFDPLWLVVDGQGQSAARFDYGAEHPEPIEGPLSRMKEPARGISWLLEAPEAHGGEVVRFPVPPEVLSEADGDLSRLRVTVEGGWVPHTTEPAVPARWPHRLLEGELQLDETGRWIEKILIEFEDGDWLASHAELLISNVAFEQQLRARAVTATRPGVVSSRKQLGRSLVSCQRGELPCRWSFPLRADQETEYIEIDLFEGIPAGANVTVALWAEEYGLRLTWPGDQGPVSLVALDKEQQPAPPRSPSGYAEALLANPAIDGTVVLEASDADPGEDTLRKGLLLAALILAIGGMLWVIARGIR